MDDKKTWKSPMELAEEMFEKHIEDLGGREKVKIIDAGPPLIIRLPLDAGIIIKKD